MKIQTRPADARRVFCVNNHHFCVDNYQFFCVNNYK